MPHNSTPASHLSTPAAQCRPPGHSFKAVHLGNQPRTRALRPPPLAPGPSGSTRLAPGPSGSTPPAPGHAGPTPLAPGLPAQHLGNQPSTCTMQYHSYFISKITFLFQVYQAPRKNPQEALSPLQCSHQAPRFSMFTKLPGRILKKLRPFTKHLNYQSYYWIK